MEYDDSLEIACENLMDYNSSDSFDSPVTPPNSSERSVRGRGRDTLNNNLAYENHRTCCHRCGNLRRHNVLCSECPYTFCARCSNKMLQEHGFDIFKNGCPVCKHACCCGPNKSVNCPRMFHCYKKCPKTKALKDSMDQNSSSAMESPLDDSERSNERHALEVLRFPSNNLLVRNTNPSSSSNSISSSFNSNISTVSTLYQPSNYSPTINHHGICPPLGKLLLQGTEERHQAPAMLPLFTPITPTSSSPEKDKNHTQPRQTATRNSRKGNGYKNSLPHIDHAYRLSSTFEQEFGRKPEKMPILNITERKRPRVSKSKANITDTSTSSQNYYLDIDSNNLKNNKHPRIHYSTPTTTTALEAVEPHLYHTTHSSPSFDLSDTFLDDDFDFLDTITSSHHDTSLTTRPQSITPPASNITEYSNVTTTPANEHDRHNFSGHPFDDDREIISMNSENTEYDNRSSTASINSDNIFDCDNNNIEKLTNNKSNNTNFQSPNNYYYTSSATTSATTNIDPSSSLMTQSNPVIPSTEDSKATEKITPLSTLSDPDSQIWKNNFLDTSFLSPLSSIDTLNLRSDFMFASSDGSLISNDILHSDDDSTTWHLLKDSSDLTGS